MGLRKERLFSTYGKWKVPGQPKRQPKFHVEPPTRTSSKCMGTWGSRAKWRMASTELASPWVLEAVDHVAECTDPSAT